MAPPSKQDMLQTLDRAAFAGNVYVMMPQDRNDLRDNLSKYWDHVAQHDGLVSTKSRLEAENAKLNARLIDCIEGGKKKCDCEKLTVDLNKCREEKNHAKEDKKKVEVKLEKCEKGREGDRTKLKECQNRVWCLEEEIKRLKNQPPKVIRVKEYITRYVPQYITKYVPQYINRYVTRYVPQYITRYVTQYVPQYVTRYVTQYVTQPCYNYVYRPCYSACAWGWNQCRRWW
ncbi:hypothetical protein SELMODRAFT_428684 [Selaginella moellendorffii]|uniref:Uncharacterized protein n=1 Tax=Selaginella moellendorffii TaxID=88036 RepID=D8T3Q0_SELML|nr:uncharacterized protein LOC9647654 [Selaginella moellendorffii]EFJ08777.1 hypothetical protein SELMODRAFT_428684 [Selaginella moellendorffii]|eukprot:XP_002990217.1 uncharacterized protein LOC9647654 [Selaginella moellendorffii]